MVTGTSRLWLEYYMGMGHSPSKPLTPTETIYLTASQQVHILARIRRRELVFLLLKVFLVAAVVVLATLLIRSFW